MRERVETIIPQIPNAFLLLTIATIAKAKPSRLAATVMTDSAMMIRVVIKTAGIEAVLNATVHAVRQSMIKNSITANTIMIEYKKGKYIRLAMMATKNVPINRMIIGVRMTVGIESTTMLNKENIANKVILIIGKISPNKANISPKVFFFPLSKDFIMILLK